MMRASHQQPGFLAALLHRLAGIALAIFLPVHFLDAVRRAQRRRLPRQVPQGHRHTARKIRRRRHRRGAGAAHGAGAARACDRVPADARAHARRHLDLPCGGVRRGAGVCCSMWSEIFASLSAATLAVLWAGAFLGGIASGAAGFAFGIAASAIWLHAIAPIHTAFLVVAGGLTIQSERSGRSAVRSMRGGSGRLYWPACSAFRSASGCWCAPTSARSRSRSACFLAVYGVYALLAPRLPHVVAGSGADAAIGFVGGILGGLGGYSGVLPAIWTQLRGWPKDEARAFYQPFIVVVHIATMAVLGAVALDRRGLVLLRPGAAGPGARHLGGLESLRPARREALPAGCSRCCCCCPALILIL